MDLPLPRVIPDVGPGGPLVTAMGGINALANDMHLQNINRIKSEYAPLTTQAEALSKLAYANLMGPQFLAKLLANDSAVANMGDPAAKAALQKAVSAGMGQGTGMGLLNQINQGSLPTSSNSLSSHLSDMVKNIFSRNQQQPGNALQQGSIPVSPDRDGNPMQMELTSGMRAPVAPIPENELWDTYNSWARSPQGQQKLAQVPNYFPSPHELSTYAQNTAQYRGTVKQGEESGKYRAEALKDIGNAQFGLSNSGAVLNRMTNIVKNPVFQNMRSKFPFFQDKQLSYLMKKGTPEEKKIIGDFLTTAESFIASTVQNFAGKPLVREFDLAQRQKITPSDPVHVAEGKLQASIALHDIAEKKNNIIKDLLKSGADEADAVEQANKLVDVSEIERQTDELLRDKPNEEDMQYMAQKHGLSVAEVKKRLKAKGIM